MTDGASGAHIPRTATFRRGEGICCFVAPCRYGAACTAAVSRQSGPFTTSLSVEEVRALSDLSHWKTADEVGAPFEQLAGLVEKNCAYWSAGRPSRSLTGERLKDLGGRLALRGNVHAQPILRMSDGVVCPFPEMPRRGSLDGAQIVAMQLKVTEMHEPVYQVVVGCCSGHALTLRDLLPRLDGRHESSSLLSDPGAQAVLAVLNDCGMLERYTSPGWDGTPRITWMGHAQVLYEAGGKRILVDPLPSYPSSPTRYAVEPCDPRDLGPLDAVLLTHGDNDHMNATALCRVPRSTPVVIPSCPIEKPYQVDMRQYLRVLGFERIIELDEWQRLTLGDVTIVATPFRGEDWGLVLPCRTYLIHGSDVTIYLNADSTSTPEAYERIAQEYRVDIAFVGVTGAAEAHAMPPGFGYGHFYATWIDPAKHNEWVALCNGPAESAEVARRLGARYAFGYAAGGAPFYTPAYSDRGSHAELARHLDAMSDGPEAIALEVGVPVNFPR
jgi:L-ascorbate metabolism protein UlaG (beta-lactamase superfamily)